MTKIRGEERWRMLSESYSLEKRHPVSNKFKYYFMISNVSLPIKKEALFRDGNHVTFES